MASTIRVRLTRKLAAVMNGVDVSAIDVGDIVELNARSAAILIAEGWAEPTDEPLSGAAFKPRVATGQ